MAIDLYTIATGPVHHSLPLRDGGHVSGRLLLDVQMEQVCDMSVALQSLEADLPSLAPERLVSLYLKFTYTGHKNPKAAAVKTHTGSNRWDYLDLLSFRATLRDLLEHGVQFWLMSKVRMGSDVVLAEGLLPFDSHYLFEDGHARDFEVPLTGEHPGSLSGRVMFENFPQFAQMVGGFHDDTGHHAARLLVEGVPNLPRCPVDGRRAEDVLAPRGRAGPDGGIDTAGGAGGAADAAPVAPPAVGTTHAAPPAQVEAVSYPPPPQPGGGGFAAAAGVASVAGRLATLPAHGGADPHAPANGSGGALASALHTGGASAPVAPPTPAAPPAAPQPSPVGSYSLPPEWERCIAPDGRVYFKNHTYHYTVWELPTEETYSVRFDYAGPLGLELEANYSGRARHGVSTGRRASGMDHGCVVKSVAEGSAASRDPRIRPGHHIVGANDQDLMMHPFLMAQHIIAAVGRPLVLHFRNPSAVSPAVGEAAKHGPPRPKDDTKRLAATGASLIAALASGSSAGPPPPPPPPAGYPAAPAPGGYPAAGAAPYGAPPGPAYGGALPEGPHAPYGGGARPAAPYPGGYPPAPGGYGHPGGYPVAAPYPGYR